MDGWEFLEFGVFRVLKERRILRVSSFRQAGEFGRKRRSWGRIAYESCWVDEVCIFDEMMM
jgi:hypothetical protein